MKAPIKLARLKCSNDANSMSPDASSNEGTLRASIDDLRSPSSRDLLRQHFSGAFPETARRSSQERQSLDGAKGRLSRSTSSLAVAQNPTAQSSSSSLDKHGLNNNRLSAVAEDQPSIDIAQAIYLLQELKKTASPGDLVALHKALLPARDSYIASPTMPNNEDRSSGNFSTSTVIRRGSMVPPGLATRGGASEDILRRQEDVKVPEKPKRSKTAEFTHLRQKLSKGSLAALDLADDAAQAPHARAATPAEDDYTVGHYRPGTLRITNGAASPEPSIMVRKSIESTRYELQTVNSRDSQLARKNVERSLFELQTSTTRESQDYATAPSTPHERPSFEYHMARTGLHHSVPEFTESPRDFLTRAQTEPPTPVLREQPSLDTPRQGRTREASRSRTPSRPRDSSISGIPHPRERDESVPRMYKRQRPHRARERSQSQTPRSRDSSVSHIPLPRDGRSSLLGSSAVAHKVSEQTLLQPLRRSLDDGRISPVHDDMPRFAHRWSHRASEISQQYQTDCDISASPYSEHAAAYADRDALLKRLSTVYDGEDEQVTAHETPETALSRLNGVPIDNTNEHKDGVSPSQHFLRNIREGRSMPHKSDSGYGTDNSSQEQQQQMSKDGGKLYNNNLRLDVDEAMAMDDDVRSLYSLNAILKPPNLLSPAATPSPQTPGARKQRSSLLRLMTSGRGDSHSSLPATSTMAETPESSPAEVKRSKSQKKKLQKPMPDSVKKELKEQRRKQKEELATKHTNVSEALTVTEEASPDPRRFSFDPITAVPTPTTATFPQTDVHSEGRPSTVEPPGKMSFHVGDDNAFASHTPLSRKRSKSLGRERRRSNSHHESADEDAARPSTPWGLRRKKSRTASDDMPPKSSGIDLPSMPCLSRSTDGEGDDEAPMWTDYSSVSRTLGCNPYDISTTMMRKPVALPGGVSQGLQSPHQITTMVSRSKTGGLQGMDSGMASELARMKSRDVAVGNNAQLFDRPRIATPRSRGEVRSMSQGTARLPPSVGGERHDRRGSLPSEEAGQQQYAELSARPNSVYAESIPPMPELPADVARVVSQVDLLVNKRVKDSAQLTPEDSQRSSEEPPGHSTISIADAVRKTLEKQHKPEDIPEQKTRMRSTGPRQQSSSSLQVQVQQILRTPSDGSIRIALGSDVGLTEEPAVTSVSQERTAESIQPDWAEQAKLWKQRRSTIGESLNKPVAAVDETPMSPVSPLTSQEALSPTIMVSRYITPFSKDIANQEVPQNPLSKADEQANAYRDLIGNDKENRPASQGTPRTQTPLSPATPERYSDQLRPQSARAAKPNHIVHQQPIQRARSPGGRVITPSGNFHPYTPADAPKAEQSRRESLQKLAAKTTAKHSSTTTTTITTFSKAARSTQSLDVPRATAVQTMINDGSLFDRYAGGYQYGFESGVGFGGSAGTRMKPDSRAQRKSKELSEGYGIDLSDVPVFLRKVS
ncbi:hypothetical protein LTR09_011325 [Extremus antarcticus]|uniref:Uncharacterized protein n=1 Tax=Extremus antarcticus TaxID=702011 RepID=A0AAJ0D6H4_9PEZI|nr:hypothetical protein LTR09_011325 [Extremus antarcticus]